MAGRGGAGRFKPGAKPRAALPIPQPRSARYAAARRQRGPLLASPGFAISATRQLCNKLPGWMHHQVAPRGGILPVESLPPWRGEGNALITSAAPRCRCCTSLSFFCSLILAHSHVATVRVGRLLDGPCIGPASRTAFVCRRGSTVALHCSASPDGATVTWPQNVHHTYLRIRGSTGCAQ